MSTMTLKSDVSVECQIPAILVSRQGTESVIRIDPALSKPPSNTLDCSARKLFASALASQGRNGQ